MTIKNTFNSLKYDYQEMMGNINREMETQNQRKIL